MPKTRNSSADEILCYSPQRASRSKVRRRYLRWREESGLAPRCDIPTCSFHTQPLIWNGKSLPLILDHENGNNRDNSPTNLRLICPNCDAQLPTRGGANRGRVRDLREGSFVLMAKGGARHYHIIAKPGGIVISGAAPVVFVSGHENEKSGLEP